MEIIKNTDLSIDFEIFDNEFIQNINVYSDKEEPLIYNFEGIRISKIKVLRIFNALLKNHVLANMDSFMFSVTYNTIINQNDYNRLADIIKKVIQMQFLIDAGFKTDVIGDIEENNEELINP